MKVLKVEDLQIALTKFCLEKNITVTAETIKAASARLMTRYTPALCIAVLHDLVFEINRFPDASIIAEKINEKIGFKFDPRVEATREAGKIIAFIKRTGFDVLAIKKALGETLYDLIGGGMAISSFSKSSNPNYEAFKAQIRDSISNYVTNKKKTECHEKLNQLNKNPALSFNNTKLLEEKNET